MTRWAASDPGSETRLSVVIITYNEADRIRECIESVLEACEPIEAVEYILVDSNSTDATVARAREYPITILRITDDEVTTPAAGRYVGTTVSRGDAVLFVDGDMRLSPAWLPRALEHLGEEGVAAVDGQLNAARSDGRVQEVDLVRGVALYDAEALASVGGFDPQLRSIEDIHVGYLLRREGYRLLRTDLMSATHPDNATLDEPLRRWRRGYPVGPGQVLRRSIRSPFLLAKYLGQFRYRFVSMAWFALGLIAVVIGPVGVLAWTALSAVAFGYVAVRLGPIGAVDFTAQKVFDGIGMVIGLVERPMDPSWFPLDVVEIVATDGSTAAATIRTRLRSTG